jgi:hypothetical protein
MCHFAALPVQEYVLLFARFHDLMVPVQIALQFGAEIAPFDATNQRLRVK